MKAKIAIIDICGTLFDSNTTFDFLDYYIPTKKYRIFRRISKLFIWRIFNKALREIFAIDITRIIALKSLQGYSKSQLIVAAEQFYNNVLVYKLIQPVREVVESLRLEGYDLILVSATLDCIAIVIAKKWNIESFYSSRLSYDKSLICRGVLRDDLLGAKTEHLRRFNIYPPFGVTLTDDFSDIKLLKSSEKCFVVSDKCKADVWIKYLKKKGVHNYQLIIK